MIARKGVSMRRKWIIWFLLTGSLGVGLTNEAKTGLWEKIAESRPLLDWGIVYPTDLTVDAEGRVYVLDAQNHQVTVLGADLQKQFTFARKGEGLGELSGPVSISLTPQGKIGVFDLEQLKMVCYTRDGKPEGDYKLSTLGYIYFGRILDEGHCMVLTDKGRQFKTLIVHMPDQKIVRSIHMGDDSDFIYRDNTGAMMALYSIPYLSRSRILDECNGLGVFASAKQNWLRLIDVAGKEMVKIETKVTRKPIAEVEYAFFLEEIRNNSFTRGGWISSLQAHKWKNTFHEIKLDHDRIYVFPVPDDLSARAGFPASIYDYRGKLLRTTRFPLVPQKIGRGIAYVIENSLEGDDLIQRVIKFKILE